MPRNIIFDNADFVKCLEGISEKYSEKFFAGEKEEQKCKKFVSSAPVFVPASLLPGVKKQKNPPLSKEGR